MCGFSGLLRVGLLLAGLRLLRLGLLVEDLLRVGGWLAGRHGRAPGAGAFGCLGGVAGQPVRRRGNEPGRGAVFVGAG